MDQATQCMTQEETKIIDKLKMEMLNAVSLQDLRFYKKKFTELKNKRLSATVFLINYSKRLRSCNDPLSLQLFSFLLLNILFLLNI